MPELTLTMNSFRFIGIKSHAWHSNICLNNVKTRECRRVKTQLPNPAQLNLLCGARKQRWGCFHTCPSFHLNMHFKVKFTDVTLCAVTTAAEVTQNLLLEKVDNFCLTAMQSPTSPSYLLLGALQILSIQWLWRRRGCIELHSSACLDTLPSWWMDCQKWYLAKKPCLGCICYKEYSWIYTPKQPRMGKSTTV